MTSKGKVVIVSAAFVVGIALLLRTGLFFLLDPGGAAEAGVRPDGAAGLTNVRVALGGFHLAMATIMAVGLFVRALRFPALLFMFLFMAVVLASRTLGIALDGYDRREDLPLMGELIVFVAMAIGLAADRWIRPAILGAR